MQLIKNSNTRYWYIKGERNFRTTEVNDGGAGGNLKYFSHAGARSRVNMVLWQELNKSCMPLNSKWKIFSMLKYNT